MIVQLLTIAKKMAYGVSHTQTHNMEVCSTARTALVVSKEEKGLCTTRGTSKLIINVLLIQNQIKPMKEMTVHLRIIVAQNFGVLHGLIRNSDQCELVKIAMEDRREVQDGIWTHLGVCRNINAQPNLNRSNKKS